MKKLLGFKRAVSFLCAALLFLSTIVFSNQFSIVSKAEENTYVYFYNVNHWSEVGAYIYGDKGELLGGWGNTTASAASEIGEDWVKVAVSEVPPFNIIFYNKSNDAKRAELYLPNEENLYVTVNGESYTKAFEAEENSVPAPEDPEEEENTNTDFEGETVVYFLDSKDWGNVRSYVYGNPGEALGSWPGQEVEKVDELGEKWSKITVPAKTPFSIIFFNPENDSERTELLLADERHVYVTGGKAVYGSKNEAELAEGFADPGLMTNIYFYDYKNWDDINGYFYEKEDNENKDSKSYVIGADWPGQAAIKDESLGENWWKVSVPKDASVEPFWGVFNNGVDQTEDIFFTNKEKVYVTPAGATYSSKEDAENAAKEEASVKDDCEEGPNTDLEKEISFDGPGAKTPYNTLQAEAAKTNGEVLEKSTEYTKAIQSEAIGRQAVKLNESGDYVEFTLPEKANSLVLRYAMPDSEDGVGNNGSLALSVDGEFVKDIELSSKHAWVYGSYPFNNTVSNGKPHRYFDETRILLDKSFEAGAKLKLEKTDSTQYYVVDLIETEYVNAPITQPEDTISVEDFGAVANDGNSDLEGFIEAIKAAKKAGKGVWIPAGNFDFPDKKAIEVNGVKIYGAGMWYTNLNGAGAAFKYSGTSKFYNFAINGVSTVRDDKGDLAAFEGSGDRATNVTIENIWIEHTKVGVWAANTENLVIQGSRIRNTYADGINMCSKTNGSVVRNNSIRNTGDDGIAIWPWLADSSNNTITHNTIQVPTLANGIAIYGGSNNKATDNYITDIINNGSGIAVGTEFDIKKDFGGTTTVSGNLLERAGSRQSDENYDIGAIWMWASKRSMEADYQIVNNKIVDAVYEGILLEANYALDKVTIKDNSIDGATYAVEVFEPTSNYGSGKLNAEISNNKTANLSVGFIKNNNPYAVINVIEEKEETVIDKIKEVITDIVEVISGNSNEDSATSKQGGSAKNENVISDRSSGQTVVSSSNNSVSTDNGQKVEAVSSDAETVGTTADVEKIATTNVSAAPKKQVKTANKTAETVTENEEISLSNDLSLDNDDSETEESEKEEKGTVVQSSDADENSISDEAVPAAVNEEANNSGIFVFAGILGVILISAIYLAVQINKKYKNK